MIEINRVLREDEYLRVDTNLTKVSKAPAAFPNANLKSVETIVETIVEKLPTSTDES